MNKKKLGNSGLEVGPLAFGGNVFGWTADEAQSFRLLDAFVDSGLNLVDTADVYSTWVPGIRGRVGIRDGRWFKQSGKRDRIVLATKLGKPMGKGRRACPRLHAARGRRLAAAFADGLHRSVPVARGRSQHAIGGDNGGVWRVDEARKVRAIGASNYNAQGWRKR